jgi:hypothetical protein
MCRYVEVYEDAADFSVGGRLKTSIRENLIFYAVIVVVAMLGIILLLAYGNMTASGRAGAGCHSRGCQLRHMLCTVAVRLSLPAVSDWLRGLARLFTGCYWLCTGWLLAGY